MEVRKAFVMAAALATATACEIDEEDFPEAYGDAYCSKYRQCDRGNYDSSYDEKSECVDDAASFMETVADVADVFGEYDPEQARECVSAVRGASCEDWNDGDFGGNCDGIY